MYEFLNSLNMQDLTILTMISTTLSGFILGALGAV
jgi:hypothetical protein